MSVFSKEAIRKWLRRLCIELGYLVFLIVLLEVTLRLGGFLLLLPRYLTQNAPPESSAEFRILAIGESTTFGFGIDPEKAYPKQLERLLEERKGLEVTVINTGVPAQTSTSILRNIRYQMDRYRPHLVISLFGINDTNEALNDLTSRIAFGCYVPECVANLRVYRLACIVKDYALHAPAVEDHGAWVFFDSAQRGPGGEWLDNPFYREQLELNYETIIEVIRTSGARMAILSYLYPKDDLHEFLARIAEENGVPYLDLCSEDTNAPDFFTEDGFHPNERGHKVMAERILEGLEREGLLPEP
jgi:lysophospholipase L1-like esterase